MARIWIRRVVGSTENPQTQQRNWRKSGRHLKTNRASVKTGTVRTVPVAQPKANQQRITGGQQSDCIPDKVANIVRYTELSERDSEEAEKTVNDWIKELLVALLRREKSRTILSTETGVSLFTTFITIALVFCANLAISFARMSGSRSSDKSGKRAKKQPQPSASEQASDSQEFLSFSPEIPPPTTPQKNRNSIVRMPDYDINMANVPSIVQPILETAASPQIPTPSESEQPAAVHGTHDSDIAKVLQIMAASLTQLNATSRSNTPVYASQLPPYPSESVPTFDGKNITMFLERFEEMAKYYEFTGKMMIDRLTAHCNPKQRAIIQASDKYKEALQDKDWKSFQKALKWRFCTNDKYQQESRAEYFEHWLAQCQARTELSTLEYLQEFHIRSKRCIEASTIEEGRRGFYLVKGLLLKQATRVLEKF